MTTALISGQDATHWLRTTVLPPLLEPGEQIGVIGYTPELHDFPVMPPGTKGMANAMWWFSSLRDRNGKALSGRQPAFVVLTSSRVLFLPGGTYIWRNSQSNSIYGAIAIRWSAVAEVYVPKKVVQKHFLNLAVRNPNQPDQLTAIKLYYWHKEKGISSQEDFVARAPAMAQERCAAARAAGLTPPPLFFDVLPVHAQHDRPDLVAAGDARREAAKTISSGAATVYGVIAAGAAIPGAWLLYVGLKNSNAAGLGLGAGCMLVAFALGKQARKPQRA
ncbi:MAG: hypothetical protein K8W52_46285 [Deltaproteobacteria bacterium]|nr:hypothetical protein [Deltaproteobacteria bacterium]